MHLYQRTGQTYSLKRNFNIHLSHTHSSTSSRWIHTCIIHEDRVKGQSNNLAEYETSEIQKQVGNLVAQQKSH